MTIITKKFVKISKKEKIIKLNYYYKLYREAFPFKVATIRDYLVEMKGFTHWHGTSKN